MSHWLKMNHMHCVGKFYSKNMKQHACNTDWVVKADAEVAVDQSFNVGFRGSMLEAMDFNAH